ncbi:hypothetical protein [Heterobasidion ambi-like virus 4]|nr:hypothetical protein [Heterobasidion ambi-like virus 4]
MSTTSFYIVQNKVTSQKSLTLFITKGLEDSVPAPIHEVPLVPFADVVSPITHLFMNNITPFIAAYNSQKPAVSFNDNRFIDFFRTFPFDAQFLGLPIVKTRGLSGTAEEQNDFFVGNGFARAQSGQALIYIGIPSPKFMKEAAPFNLELYTQADRGQTNMLGFAAFVKITKIIKLVTHLHNEICDDMSSAIGLHFPPDLSTDRMQIEDDEDGVTLIDEKMVNSNSKWTLSGDLSAKDLVKSTASLGDGVLVAIPVSKKKDIVVSGPVADCPFEEGLPIPYFHGSIIGDMYHAANFFQTHFLPLFGSDLRNAIENFQDFRKGCFSLGTTKKGMALSHMLVVMELAMKVGNPVYFCIEGEEYCGAVIGGSGFSILRRNVEFKALKGESFVRSMQAVTGHEGYVRAVGKLLSACSLRVAVDSAEKMEVTREMMKSSRAVYKLIRARRIEGTDDGENDIEKELMALLEKCSFDTSYMAVTAENLLAAFDQIVHPDKDIWDDKTPLYLPSCALSASRSVFIMSAFGRFGPSLLTTKGEVVALPTSDKREDDPALRPHPTIPDQRLMASVAYYLKPTVIAAADAEKVIKKKEVLSELNMKGRPVKSSGQFGGKERDTFWYGLGLLLKDHKTAGMSKKRKAEGKAESEEAKKRKMARQAELFLESMW